MATIAGVSVATGQESAAGLTRSGAVRLDAIDMLRGLVIVLMALDHVRDFFHIDAFRYDPVDPARSYPLLFATRWITHLCAPTFVFLAGVSIWMQRENGKRPSTLSAFLVKRGLWLILLEMTVVSFGINFAAPFVFLQVIWAIGASMVGMALLTALPARAVLAIGVAVVALSPLALPLREGMTGLPLLGWTVLFAPGPVPGLPLLVTYAAVPWFGVMCIGFGLAPLFRLPPAERDRMLLRLSAGLIATFVLLRSLNGYGDPVPWQSLPDPVRTGMSFVNISKYPPSPDYVLATLGIALLLFVALGHVRGWVSGFLLTLGRTSMFTYLCHFYVAHLLMAAVAVAMGFPFAVATDTLSSSKMLDMNYGFSLPIVYLAWLTVLAIVYPLSRWFEGVKRRRRDWWLSYL